MLRKFSKTFKYFESEKKHIAVIVVLKFILLLISVIQPLLYAGMISCLLNKQIQELSLFIVFLIVSYLLLQLFHYLLKRTEAKTAKNINYYVKCKAAEYLLQIPNYKVDFSQGKMYSLLVTDSNAVYSVVSAMISIFFTALNVVGIGLAAVCINWQLCVILMLPYPLIVFINHKFQKIIKESAVDVANQNDKYINHVKNMVENIRDIKNQNGARKILWKIGGEAKKGRDLSIKQMMLQTKFDGSVSTTGMLGHIALTVAGVYNVYKGVISFGSFVAFNNYSKVLSSSIDVLVNVRTNLQPLMVSLERIFELEELSRKYADSDCTGERAVEGIDSICFEKVSLSYGDNEILHQVDFCLKKGKIVGFVGKNGSGKTSMMNLVMQNILPTKGEVLFNGSRAESYPYFSLRNHFEYIGVKQNIYYLSIYDNIALSGNETFEKKNVEKVRQVCSEVGLLQDIDELKDAFDTQIQDEGMFSTGQSKKLQIARAFIKDSSVLVLDEVLTNLDNVTKSSLADKLRKLAQNKIILLISHNMEDYEICDEIYRLEEGHLEKIQGIMPPDKGDGADK